MTKQLKRISGNKKFSEIKILDKLNSGLYTAEEIINDVW